MPESRASAKSKLTNSGLESSTKALLEATLDRKIFELCNRLDRETDLRTIDRLMDLLAKAERVHQSVC